MIYFYHFYYSLNIMSISSDFIESNGEKFIKADYNGISILIREKTDLLTQQR